MIYHTFHEDLMFLVHVTHLAYVLALVISIICVTKMCGI